MIVLTQKIAGGLYLHNWLHDSQQLSSLSHGSKTVSQANCSCIDDFYAPFTEPVILSAETPLSVQVDFFPVRKPALPIVAKYFHSLRAPPVSISFSS